MDKSRWLGAAFALLVILNIPFPVVAGVVLNTNDSGPGSLRAAIVPAVAVPLSLIGAAFLMLLMGFSVNLLTLLAMVLAMVSPPLDDCAERRRRFSLADSCEP